ncbi:DUF421 domain-containing protein [Qipengyuania sp. DY56-A-20]|jgi:uncharacterized membrane protein YcaP (DUF421 family)|uniref:DUF421 domain-containing protein n=1 Tax=Qipengyuania benthica TaxID=3067651 RepID=A0ABT9H505_9SPHN|nr:YetF domain-containing protein [Qipengyuania sp. DY56-A-20]MBU1254209.1 DUF421 domain-containing protein [Alphaproteobacteria bacterium]MBU1605264.1 DUF421 domain-containing protein [Alphaproteobacteria bacterium]MDP4538399.1 DUF421 domain-containing protein [Qipengyuania sp. DY56-A-20]
MFFDDTTLDIVTRALVLSAIGVAWVVALVRLVGLRTLSKMTNFDFVITLATGSLLAGLVQATAWTGFFQALLAMAALIFLQFLLARLRRSSDRIEAAIQNGPMFLMYDGEFIDEALKVSRVARSDVLAKLRESNALEMGKVRAVVLETTGDVSVLHGDRLDDRVVEGIERP